MLKKSALKKFASFWEEYLNPLVFFAYVIFLGCSFLSMWSLKGIDLSLSTVLESTGYIFVTVLGAIFLKEKINRQKIIGMLVIIMGVLIYSIKI